MSIKKPIMPVIASYFISLTLLCLLGSNVWATTTSALTDQTCGGFRFGSELNCTAGEFTVAPVFSAETGTEPFCMIGSSFNIKVEVTLSDTNADRQDIGFFVGQDGNDPALATAGNICSVATFPTDTLPAISPWKDNDGDVCGDYNATGLDTILIDEIKVNCDGGPTGFLEVPYLVTYWQNNGNVCTGPTDVTAGSKSKCNKGVAEVAGAVAVNAGAFFDITKATTPTGDTQVFNYTATGPVGSKVIALVGATLTPTSAVGGTFIPAAINLATETTNFTLQDGETVRVFIGATAAAQTLEVVEALETGWDPTASITCGTVQGAPATNFVNATRTMSADLTDINYGAECTITNIKRPAVTLTKVSNGDVGTFNFTGTNSWASQDITTVSSGVGVVGVTQYLPYSVATDITETALAGFSLAGLNCTVSAGSAIPNLVSRTVSLDATAMGPGETVDCTYTNARQRNLTVVKSLLPGGDSGLFVMDANGTVSLEGGDGTSAGPVSIGVGATANFAETVGTGTSFANYTESYSCDDPAVTAGSGTSSSLTMPNQDVICTFTNTRLSASLVLEKTWENAINGNTVTVTSSSFTNNGTSGASVSTGNNTTAGSAVTVYSGEAGTIAESFSVGNAINYNSALACTGTSGLSGSTLTVAPADSNITCTYTNSRKSANFTLAKTWVNAFTGNTATVTSTGFGNNATSGASVTTGNNTTTGTSVTVYATEVGNIAESFSVGVVGDYSTALSCSGTSGLAGSTLTVAPADTDIVCTFTNSGLQPSIAVIKTPVVISDSFSGANPKAIPGAVMTYTIRVTNSGLGTVDNNTLILTDLLPTEIIIFVNDFSGPGTGPVQFTDGAVASGLNWNYVSLADGGDDLEFSNDSGATWTYTPTPDADGYDNAVTDIRFNPQGVMNAAGGGDPYFELTFQVKIP